MEPDAIDHLLKVSWSMFYSDFMVMICQLIAIKTAVRFYKREKWSIPFLIYSCAAFLLVASNDLRVFWYPKNASSTLFSKGTNIIFVILEYIIFYHFFMAILASAFAKKIISSFYPAILIAGLFFFYKIFFQKVPDSLILTMSDLITSAELFIISATCLVYYIELFRKKPVTNLLKSPSFWIVTALFFIP